MQMMTAQRAYPAQDIPSEGFAAAYEYHRKTFTEQTRSEPWTPMGPLNTAGRTLSLAINPQNDQTIYLGSASGGLWKSHQLGEGQSWQHIPTGHPVLGVSAIAIHPTDSLTMYIGTGEVYNYQRTGTDAAYRATRGSYGIGILKTTDGGINWEPSLDWTYDQQRGVQEVKMAPSNSDILYAATTHGVYKSVDAGSSWSQIFDIDMATDIAIHDINPDRVIATVGNLGSPAGGIYVTNDGGGTWTAIDMGEAASFQGKIQIDHLGDLVMASIGNGFSFTDGFTWIMRSENFGDNWQLIDSPDYSRWQGWFAHDVAINPRDPSTSMHIGIDVWKSTENGLNLDKKSNGGVTLGRPDIVGPDGDPSYSHSDHHVVLYHPNIPDLVLLGNDGGLFKSSDGGETFASANGGLQTTQFYNGFSVSQQQQDFAMGGLQDNSTSIFRGDGRWQRAIGGDGSWTAINPTDDNIAFGSSQNLNVRKSTDNGNFFTSVNVRVDGGGAVFIAPYVISPAAPQIMYAGGEAFYRSLDGGNSWSVVTGKPNTDPIFSMAASHQDASVVYVGTAPFTTKPRLYVTSTAGASWTDVTGDLPDRYPNDIAIDPTDDNTAYVTFSGFGTGHIFKTIDRGASWTDISQNLPDVPGNAVVVDPTAPSHLYYGNDIGIYFSTDGGDSWEAWDAGIRDAAIVLDLVISPSDESLWAATHGRGTYKRQLMSAGMVATADEAPSPYRLYPNPATDFIHVAHPGISSANTEVQIFSTEGALVHQHTLDYDGNIDVSALPAAQYIFIVKREHRSFAHKITIIR